MIALIRVPFNGLTIYFWCTFISTTFVPRGKTNKKIKTEVAMNSNYVWFIIGAFTGCIITAIGCGIENIDIRLVIQRLKESTSSLKQSEKEKLLKTRKQ